MVTTCNTRDGTDLRVDLLIAMSNHIEATDIQFYLNIYFFGSLACEANEPI